ncbi:MAG: AAA family ATPase [Methanoregulaceae archaeon]
MAIRSISLANFKSFSDLSISLRDFNVIIGSNAAGKSNFIQAFRFLRDIAVYGLENAIAMQGGFGYLLNARLGTGTPLSFSVTYSPEYAEGYTIPGCGEETIVMRPCESTYAFSLRFAKDGSYTILHDELTLGCDFNGECTREPGSPPSAFHGKIRITNEGGRLRYTISVPEGITLTPGEIVPLFFREGHIPATRLILETPYALPVPQIDRLFDRIGIYDLDPKLPKKGVAIAGKCELEEDGSNLALAIRRILDNPEKRRTLANLIRDVFPFIEDLDVKKSMDVSWVLTLRERYAKEYDLPAFALSDGTLSIFMLIIILYFEDRPFVFVEEPVSHIHPFLVTRVVSMMKEASERKQVMMTTHSVEAVKHTGLESILLISRNRDGFSTISRPADKEEVRTFLENELGIEDLYLQNLLEF